MDEDAIKKVFEESGTVAKFKFFEYDTIADTFIAYTHVNQQPYTHTRAMYAHL